MSDQSADWGPPGSLGLILYTLNIHAVINKIRIAGINWHKGIALILFLSIIYKKVQEERQLYYQSRYFDYLFNYLFE